MAFADYLDIIYSPEKKPESVYPSQLVGHLCEKFDLKKGDKILEPGVGTGNFLQPFQDRGLKCSGCDLSAHAGADLKGKNIELKTCNIEVDGLPYKDNQFDVVYSKSLLEHFVNPGYYLQEVLRVLKPGGKCLTLVPDWEVNYRTFYDDPTHKSPFTKVSLRDIYLLNGFEAVAIEKLRQLPIVWKFPQLNVICSAISPFVPIRTQNKFLRWSRELMLIGYGQKPK